jgi:hypothetical protein
MSKPNNRARKESAPGNEIFDLKYVRNSIMPPERFREQTWFMQHLLRGDERLEFFGDGVSTLLGASLEDILSRWMIYMVSKAMKKLEPIIQLLEAHLVYKGLLPQLTTHQWFMKANGSSASNEK